MTDEFDFVVIGAGIAGAALAYELAPAGRVLLVEQEQNAGYHTTGRSAAQFSELYGSPGFRKLTTASRQFFEQPPNGFTNVPLLTPRGFLFIARADQKEAFEAFHKNLPSSASVQHLSAQTVTEHVPILRSDRIVAGLLETDSKDIDVHAVHQGYLRAAQSQSVRILTGHQFQHAEHRPSGWRMGIGDVTVCARVIVNAAGAWADDVAQRSGLPALGLAPFRRTAVLLAIEAPTLRSWPTVIDIDEQFYFKPDAGKLLLSPADETLSPPCDCRPEEMDIAIAVDRFEQATALQIRRVEHSWAGLRTFAPDREAVIGSDPLLPDFFWLAGQGGYGIQSAPAAARAAASLLTKDRLPQDLLDLGLSAALFSPARLRT